MYVLPSQRSGSGAEYTFAKTKEKNDAEVEEEIIDFDEDDYGNG